MSGKWISGPAAFLILVLFFLPWVTVSCNGQPIGELTGYELASGGNSDVAVNTDFQLLPSGGQDLALYFFPLAGLLTFGLLALGWIRPKLTGVVGWGQAVLGIVGLLILLLEWLQLSGSSDGAFEINVMPALWGTAVALLLILTGGGVDIWDGLHRRRVAQGTDWGNVPWSPPPARVDSEPWPPQVAVSPGMVASPGMAATDPGRTDVDAAENWSFGYGATQVDSDEFAAPDLPGGTAPLAKRGLVETAVDPEEVSQSWNPPPKVAAQEAASPVDEAVPLAWLVMLEGPKAGEQYRLQKLTRLGRGTENEIVLADTAVSSRHAQVAFQDGQYHYQDLGSTNGSLLLDEASQQWKTVDHIILSDGMQLKLGRIVFHFMSVGRVSA